MKKVFLVAFLLVSAIGCRKMDNIQPTPYVNPELTIEAAMGLKLQSPFVTSEVVMNVKSDIAQSVTIKIFDIGNKIVSKETMDVKVGDNILKVYTNILPSSAYRIGLYDVKGNQMGITDFNKL